MLHKFFPSSTKTMFMNPGTLLSKPVSVFVFCFVITQAALAQAPIIKPAQFIIRIQSTQPNDYDGWNSVGYSRQYLFYDQANTLLSTTNSYGPGSQTLDVYVTESNKPSRLSAKHKVSYQYYHCDEPDPNCEGEPIQVRTAGTNNTPSQNLLPPCNNCYWIPSSFYTFFNENIPVQYPAYDSTFNYSTNSVRVQVIQASDNNYNLPSGDNISIQGSGDMNGYIWEYQLLEHGTQWFAIPAGLIMPGGASLFLKGESLFGSNWMTHINKTVLFRLRNATTGVTSNILVYTHRLSSPRIVSTETFNNPCFGFDTAYIKVKFDRLLLSGEKINIFLKDTTLGLDYSALNLDNSHIDNSTLTYTWPRELVQGGYKVALIGKYQDIATYTGSPQHFSFVRLTDPPLVGFYLKQDPALCFGGNSGKITIAAKGGVGNYKYEMKQFDSLFLGVFTNFPNPVPNPAYGTMEQGVPNLTSQIYKIRIRDGNGCMNRDSLGNEVARSILVKQPETGLTVSHLNISPITSNDSTNGSITIRLTGGTPFTYYPEDPPPYYKYRFEWRDSATNTLITNYTLDTTGMYQTSIRNLPQGTYRFKAWDGNYEQAINSNRQGCLIDIYIRLTRPNPLTVSINPDSLIRCNGDANGKLKALSAGGIPLSDSVSYNFTWFKQSGSNFINLNINDSVISNVSAGIYKVEIRDRYNNLKISNTYTLVDPPVLGGTSSTTPASCFFSPNGSMSVSPSGGTAPYSYEWNTGHFTQTVNGIPGGSYVVVIKDAHGCQHPKQVLVTSPAKITSVPTITPVGCSGSSSGAISLSVSGGAGGYTYLWSNGSTNSSANNLGAGRHWYTVSDANGCYDTDTFDLENPESYSVTVGPDRKICTGQTIQLRTTITGTAQNLTTTWTGPQGTQTGNTINVTTTGTYIVTVSNASGCQKKDTIVVTPENATVNTTITVSTQIFASENTTLVNISPSQQDSAVWLLPANSNTTVISSSKHFCEMRFADTGRYVVGLRAYYSNGCIDEVYKEVNVVRKQAFINTGNQAEAFLKQFGLYPNPTTGNFTLTLLFNSTTIARVRIINVLTNSVVTDRTIQGSASYSEQFNIGAQPGGTYIVLIETPKGSFVHKVTKQ
jgi:hypothetical protein